jgi:hypothetical protein
MHRIEVTGFAGARPARVSQLFLPLWCTARAKALSTPLQTLLSPVRQAQPVLAPGADVIGRPAAARDRGEAKGSTALATHSSEMSWFEPDRP